MRRKLIRQGKHSLTLTLPAKWVQKNNLDEDSEVLLFERNNRLLVGLEGSANTKPLFKKTSFDVTNYDERTIRNILNQTYRAGFDSITLYYLKENQLNEIKEITKTLLGFDVVDVSEKRCVVENIAEPSEDKFDKVLRKIFLLIKTEGEQLFEDFKEADYSFLKRIVDVKLSVDTYTNYCRRIVCKKNDPYISHSLYHLLSRLSLLHHAYYYMAKCVLKKKPKQFSKEVLRFFKETNQMFSLFYTAFYAKDLRKFHDVGVMKNKLIFGRLYDLLSSRRGVDNVICYHLGEIVRLTQMSSTNAYAVVIPHKSE